MTTGGLGSIAPAGRELDPPSSGRRAGPWLALIFAVALALRLGFVFALDPDRIYFPDSIDYLKAAESILHGGGFGETYKRPPLYSVFLAGILAVGGGKLVVVKIVEAILGAVTVLVVYQLAKAGWGRNVGLIAAGLVAVHPYLFVLSAFVYSEIMFTLLMLLATWLLLRAGDWRGVALAGFLGGLACLARPAAMGFLAAGALWLVMAGTEGLRRRVGLSLVLLLSGAFIIAPWLSRNYNEFGALTPLDARSDVHLPYKVDGRFVSKLEYLQVWKATHPISHERPVLDIVRSPGAYAVYVAGQLKAFWTIEPDELQTSSEVIRERAAAHDPRMIVQNHPSVMVARYGWVLGILLAPYYVLAVVGAFAARKRFREYSLYLLIILSFAFGYAMFFGRLRYRLPIEPYVAIFAAVGIQTLGALRGRRRG